MDDAKSKELTDRFGLGATGAFPHGNLGPRDEGELKVAVGIEADKVVIHFGKKVAWVAVTREQALQLAAILAEKAGTMEPKGA